MSCSLVLYLFSLYMSVLVLTCIALFLLCFVFFFKQKTAYEMRISDWSSDVCSSESPFGFSSYGMDASRKRAEHVATATGKRSSSHANASDRFGQAVFSHLRDHLRR